MAEMKFNCPQCSQLISCDELWAGQQIQCPICQAPMMVPAQGATAATPAPASPKSLVPEVPKGSAPRLSIGQARHAPASPPPQASASSTLAKSAAQFAAKPKKKSGLVQGLIWGAVLIAIGVGGYYGFMWVKDYQDKKNAQDRAAAADSGGGEFGHAKHLNDVLDATDPANMGRISAPRRSTGGGGNVSPQASAAIASANAAAAGSGANAANTAVVPPNYTLDTNILKITDGKVNGTVSGTNFVADGSRIDPISGQLVLRFYQGNVTAPDRALYIYLKPKLGEPLAGHEWLVGPDVKGGPSIIKMWKALPTAPQMANKSFATGYAMDLKLEKIASGKLYGKIFLALPDTEQSVISGAFQADTKLPDSPAAGATPAGAKK
jgi:hypothetical protein